MPKLSTISILSAKTSLWVRASQCMLPHKSKVNPCNRPKAERLERSQNDLASSQISNSQLRQSQQLSQIRSKLKKTWKSLTSVTSANSWKRCHSLLLVSMILRRWESKPLKPPKSLMWQSTMLTCWICHLWLTSFSKRCRTKRILRLQILNLAWPLSVNLSQDF